MPNHRSWSKSQMEWYHSRRFKTHPWWKTSDKRKAKRPDGKDGVAHVPALWEVLRRHPDVGQVLQGPNDAPPVPREVLDVWLDSILGQRSAAHRLLNLLAKSGGKPWPALSNANADGFESLIAELIEKRCILIDSTYANPAPICDLFELLSLGTDNELGLPEHSKEKLLAAARRRSQWAMGSIHEMTLFELQQAISFVGRDLMVMAVDRNCSIDAAVDQFRRLLKVKQTTQLLSERATLRGPYQIESKCFTGPPPPHQLIQLFEDYSPGVKITLNVSDDGTWSMAKRFGTRSSRVQNGKKARLREDVYTLIEQLDAKKTRAYPSIRRMMSRFSLFSLR